MPSPTQHAVALTSVIKDIHIHASKHQLPTDVRHVDVSIAVGDAQVHICKISSGFLIGALAAGSWQQKDAANKWQPLCPVSDGLVAHRAKAVRLEQIIEQAATQEGVPNFGGFDAMALDDDSSDEEEVTDYALMKKNAARLSQPPSKKKAGGRGGGGKARNGGKDKKK